MNIKEWLRFIYGMTMGTSVQYIKPSRRFLWPSRSVRLDSGLSVFLGGSGVCGLLHQGQNGILINTNQGTASESLKQFADALGVRGYRAIINTSLYRDFTAGNPLFMKQAEKVFLGAYSARALLKEWSERPIVLQTITEEFRFEFADEMICIVPVGNCVSEADLIVFFEKRRILFLGGLFYNRIHPVLHSEGFNISKWLVTLEEVLKRFQPATVVPAEGDLGTIQDVELFIRYLRDLQNPQIEFQYCRQNYDWIEIPSLTSLEENFDLLRQHIKSHVTFR